MNKKILKLVTVALAIFLLGSVFTGCSRKKENADVHVFYYTYSDPYISTVRSSLDGFLKSEGSHFTPYLSANSSPRALILWASLWGETESVVQ